MNKHWDYEVPKVELWKECLRVLKPGGHLLSFAGTRTYHRMTVNIEDAGFEIRDMISWIYGSGFPKSLDIGKAIDKMKGAEREIIGYTNRHTTKKKQDGSSFNLTDHWVDKNGKTLNTAPATPEAIQWNGWGTALKPACEPICVARKPVEGTIANNVLEYGTGGINIDGCKIGTETIKHSHDNTSHQKWKELDGRTPKDIAKGIPTFHTGRFPANIIFDEIAGVMLDEQSGELKSGDLKGNKTGLGNGNIYGTSKDRECWNIGDKGGASRFFYCAKASKAERNGGLEGFEEKGTFQKNTSNFKYDNRHPDGGYEHKPQKQTNHHPTVKPLKLMQYLVRLVTPPNGICLDPFCGSGTTLMACVKEGFNYIGIEREAEYVKIAEARIEWIKKQKEKEEIEQPNLFQCQHS